MALSTRQWRRLAAIGFLWLTVMPAAVRAAPPAHPAALPAPSPAAAGPEPAHEIRADTFGRPLAADDTAALYAQPSVLLQAGDRVQFSVTIAAEGLYTLAFDVAAGPAAINPPEGLLYVDGATALADAQRVVFPVYYENSRADFPLDRYGNQALIRQQRLVRWVTADLRNAAQIEKYPVQHYFTPGAHTFDFELTQEALYLGSVYLFAFTPPPTYSQYVQANAAVAAATGVLITLEAEQPTYKNDTSIRPVNSRSLEVTPYDTYQLLLNTLGGDSWIRSGSAVYYVFDVPADGLYALTLRAQQNTRSNFTVFRRITLNGAVPFDELNAVAFPYSATWTDITLGGETPYQLYLSAGRHVLGVEATASPYTAAIAKIRKVLVDINTLSLEIKKLTGNQVDQYKEWVLSDYIPDIRERLLAIAADLQVDLDGLTAINQGSGSPEVLTYQMAIDNIVFLAEDPDEIPTNMKRFSEGSGSAAQLLANLLPTLQNQPLALDKIYIHALDTPPQPAAVPVLRALTESLKRFIHSFRPDPYLSIGAGEEEIEVWVNRPRQYLDLMQNMTDELFTPETGIRVKFSIMPDESKLVLANAAGIEPDVALGVSTNVPYELAIRNALKDLRTFDDFDRFIRIYSPGALLSYIIDDSAYAIPETQDFWVTYARQDILTSLGLPVPTTWNEVIEILPELQRYGLNYNTALSAGSGTKPLLMTAPYIFNHGAELYRADGFATGLGSEEAIAAIKFMAESFTIYGLPLTTASFYDSFRAGSLPLGVSNFETYIKLMTAAPEIDGRWTMDLYPATVLADGTLNRYATGSAQAGIIFANTDQPAEAWEFLKWWMSTETQVDFQQQLILNYGLTYLWNSANLEAFAFLPIPDEHRAVILEQWQWLQEPVKLPGSYMEERELSNAWNKIVFDGVNPRVAIDNSVVVINREIARKMEEFGYLENGVPVRTFTVPTIEMVQGWMDNAD